MKENTCENLLGKIYILYYKSKIALAKAHLFRNPKNYIEDFKLSLHPNYDLEILSYLIRKCSPGYNDLSRKSWILFVLEINKVLSCSKHDKFSIMKLYNKLKHRDFKGEVPLSNFEEIIGIIQAPEDNSVLGKLRVLRDKFYAHSDDNFNELTESLFPTYNEAWVLMFSVEKFLKSMYHHYDGDVCLHIEHHINKYFIDFERIYRYFQQTEDIKDTYRLNRNFTPDQLLRFRSLHVG